MKKPFVALVCTLALAGGTYACAGDATPPSGEATGTTGTTGTTTRVADIVGAPDQYRGRAVTVVADVEEVHGPMAFSLDEDAPAAGGIDNDLLVLFKKSSSLANIDDQWANNKVRVSGVVGKMAVVELERELGWDLDPELEVELERVRAVRIANSVERVEK